jgi:uncharacterized protein (TIGR03067 family)
MDPGLQGTWQMIRAELAGGQAPELVVQRTVVTLASGQYEVRFGGQLVDRGTYEAAETATFRTLVLRGAAGNNAGRTIPCIYQLAGDRLRVCYGLDGTTPNDFTTAPGQQRYLATYRRTPG